MASRGTNSVEQEGLERGYGSFSETRLQPAAIHDEPPDLPNGHPNSTRELPRLDSHPTAPKRKPTLPNETPISAKREIFNAPTVRDLDPAVDRLDNDPTPLSRHEFCTLMGLQQPLIATPDGAQIVHPAKARAAPDGLVARIHASHKYTNTKYRVFDVLTYALLVLQLVLSALFVILGSLPSLPSRIPIAVLGAIGTVIAGSLAMMKGQGLPNRLRKQRDGLDDVLLEADELCWDFGAGKAVLYRDVRRLREDYLRVVEEGRRNHPDSWNGAPMETVDAKKKGANALR